MHFTMQLKLHTKDVCVPLMELCFVERLYITSAAFGHNSNLGITTENCNLGMQIVGFMVGNFDLQWHVTLF